MGNGCRARVSTGPTISITATRPINPHGVAKRILVLMPVAPIANLAFEKPAGGDQLPQQLGQIRDQNRLAAGGEPDGRLDDNLKN